MTESKVLIAVPTYNEAENIEAIVDRLLVAVPKAHIVIVDDNSPDGTGEIADRLSEAHEYVNVLHRAGKEGLGAAYIEAFKWGLDAGYDVIVEHDADGSHRPEDVPSLLEALAAGADVAKGSRWIKGGKVENWPLSRELLSRGGNLYAKLWLGIPVNDATGGFTAWKAETLRSIDLEGVEAAGYCFQVDLAWRAVKGGFKVVEVPITFAERERGVSKMNGNIVVEAMLLTTKWGVNYRANQIKDALSSSEIPEKLDKAGINKENAEKVTAQAEIAAKKASVAAAEAARKLAEKLESFGKSENQENETESQKDKVEDQGAETNSQETKTADQETKTDN